MMEEHQRLIKEENAAEDKRNQVKSTVQGHDLEETAEEQKAKREAYELLKEKLMIDEIVRKIPMKKINCKVFNFLTCLTCLNIC